MSAEEVAPALRTLLGHLWTTVLLLSGPINTSHSRTEEPVDPLRLQPGPETAPQQQQRGGLKLFSTEVEQLPISPLHLQQLTRTPTTTGSHSRIHPTFEPPLTIHI